MNNISIFNVLLVLATVITTPHIRPDNPVLLCNGKPICDRKYNKVAQINVHNATSTKKGNLFDSPHIVPCPNPGSTFIVHRNAPEEQKMVVATALNPAEPTA
ncbi:MAG: hypothetical protein P4L31_00735 [Candidatus Babeliales bacterium]|nr:hypothetical protein [Candidatus Babeliales bacterium]